MDGMMTKEAPLKPSVALGLQFQVQVSDNASVMFSTHVDRDDVVERNKTLDLVHACAERLFHRYRVTALRDKIRGAEFSIEHTNRQRELDIANYTADTARRAEQKDQVQADDLAQFASSGRRGEYKTDAKLIQRVARIDADQKNAFDLHWQQLDQAETSIRKLTSEREVMLAEIEQLEASLKDGTDR